MNALITRLVFVLVVVAGVLFFIVNTHQINIDTNLNDLNPDKVNDPGLQYALDSLTENISQRFVIAITGDVETQTQEATKAIQSSINALPALTVVMEDEVQSAYFSALTPYRFNLLTPAQQEALTSGNSQQIAEEAQRKLYQFGNGVRLVPFNDDPLGWYSEYLLSGLDNMNGEEGEELPASVNTFSVMFNNYPASLSEQETLYQQIKEIEAQVEAQFDVDILHSGMFFFAVDSAQSAKSDIQLIAVGSGVGVLVLMLLVFRSLLPLMLSLTSIAIGVGFGVLASIAAFGSVHILTIVFGASLIGIVVDYSLHYFYHFLSQSDEQQQPHSEKAGTLFRAMLLSVVTSLVGYGALSLSELTILKKIALFSCSGLVMAWLSVMIFGPFIVKRPIEARQTLLSGLINLMQKIFARRPALLAVGGVAAAIGCGVFIFTGNTAVNDDPRRFFHVSPSLLQQEQDVASLTQVYEPGRYLLVRGDTPQDIFDALTSLYKVLEDDSQGLSSILDWLPSPKEQRENYVLQGSLYASGGALDAFSGKLGMPDSTFDAVKRQYTNAEKSVISFSDLMEQLPSLPPLWIAHDGGLYSFALIKKNSNLAGIETASQSVRNVTYVNTLANASQALQQQREAGTQLLVLAYGLIALLLLLYYRKVSAVMLLLVPAAASLIAVAMVLAMGQALTIFHVMALFLVLGLGMDYIIFAKEMANQRRTTQQAILLSAVTSLLSFGLLAFSSMPIVQAFGSIILIGNTINFIAAISLFNGDEVKQENNTYVR